MKRLQSVWDFLHCWRRAGNRIWKVRDRLFFVEVGSVIHWLDVGNERWHHCVQTVPLNVAKPFMSFDIFGIIWKYVAASIVLMLTGRWSLILQFVPSGAEPAVFLLDDAPDKVLAPLTDDRFVRETECGLMSLLCVSLENSNIEIGICQLTRIFTLVCCLPPSSARKGVWP